MGTEQDADASIRRLWKRLGALREERGISGPEAARRMGVHSSRIYRWEQDGVRDLGLLALYASNVLESEAKLDLSTWELTLYPYPKPKPERIVIRADQEEGAED